MTTPAPIKLDDIADTVFVQWIGDVIASGSTIRHGEVTEGELRQQFPCTDAHCDHRPCTDSILKRLLKIPGLQRCGQWHDSWRIFKG